MKTRIFALLFTTAFVAVLVNSCKEDEPDKCEGVTGATFTSDSGKIKTLLETKCGIASCHAPGGAGNAHWTYYDVYDSISAHFHHMYEAVIEEGEMPPDTAVALTQEEKALFECWEQSGFPE